MSSERAKYNEISDIKQVFLRSIRHLKKRCFLLKGRSAIKGITTGKKRIEKKEKKRNEMLLVSWKEFLEERLLKLEQSSETWACLSP